MNIIHLTDEELEKDRTLVTAATEPVPVRAWVRDPETVIRATGIALAWTDRAVRSRCACTARARPHRCR